MKILWLDTETTGLKSQVHGLREVGYIVEVDGVEKEKGVIYINPFSYNRDVLVDNYALEISDKTIGDLLEYPDSAESFDEFSLLLNKYVDTSDESDYFVMAGYNVNFDIGFIREWFHDIISFDEYKQFFHYKSLDVFALVFSLRAMGLIDTENDKLETICRFFEIDIDAHDALSDIEATKLLFEQIQDRYIAK